MKLLAVDDDDFILELLPMILEEAGYRNVVLASSAEVALDMIELSDDKFDCFLLDIQMPGMDGVELCKRIREMKNYARTPVLMLTTAGDKKHIDRAFSAGATDYATKPFDVTELGLRLRHVLDGSKESQAALLINRGHGLDDPHTYSGFRSEVSSDILLAMTDRLIEFRALTNYLLQLARSKHGSSQILAIRADQIMRFRGETTEADFLHILSEVANSISETLKSHECFLAYAGRGNFVSVSQHITTIDPVEVEEMIRSSLSDKKLRSEKGELLHLEISIGLPLRPPASKLRYVEKILSRAIARAENRLQEKHRVPNRPDLRRAVGFNE